MGINFTKDQQRVIDTRHKNVLVSAAAGSGKTAVLVERIIQMVMDKENPIDIDRLLVVTFTEAAAAQMKDKIADAIDSKLAEEPENMHLQKQASLIYRAQISTIHGFCLNIIKNNFNKIGLDPSFRVADETELNLMKEDVLEDLFEEKYQSDDEDFLRIVEFFNKADTDQELRDRILELYTFSQGYPWPEEFLNECIRRYEIEDSMSFEKEDWVQFLVNYAETTAKAALSLIEEAKKIIEKPYGPYNYAKTLEKDIETINNVLSSSTYEEYQEALSSMKWVRLESKAGDDVDEVLKNEFKNVRDRYKDLFGKKTAIHLGNFFQNSIDSEIEIIKKIYPYIKGLVELVIDFSKRFEELRREKCVISFSDMEHYALNILCNKKENGEVVPTETAELYQDLYEEILMDEYQDCNRVQELLMWCVSSESRGKFNRFMVGDVKQSIYKFRLSNPQLFIEKYNSYKTDDQDGQNNEADNNKVRINLKQNFRSRESVLKTTNDLFGQIMRRSLGGIEYDDDAKLVLGASYPDYSDANKDDLSATQIMFAINSNDSDDTREILEAKLVARKIKQLMKTQIVKDDKENKFRPLSYKDIVILVRAMTDVADGIREVFSKEGIPLFMNTSVGFYSAKEIQEIIQLLKILDNPLQDIPLYGVLTSYFGNMTDEDVARMKIEAGGDSLFEKLKDYSVKDTKAREFLEFLRTYQDKAVYTSVRELVSEIIENTGYLEYVTSMAGGEQRRANVKLLISFAQDYENTTYKGLFHFVRYLKEVQKVDSRTGEADVLDENADVVRIMTIHKSKGLEFPVVFLCGVHKQFNDQDTKGLLSIDMDFGVGSRYVDINQRTRTNSLFRKAVNLKMKQDMLSEELRILYVALTRAKEKLIITGVCKEKNIDDIKLSSVSFEKLMSAKSYMDFMTPLFDNVIFEGSTEDEEANVNEAIDRIVLKGELLKKVKELDENDERVLLLKERFAREYAHKELEGLVTKTSVSELKKAYLDTAYSKKLFEEKPIIPYEPGFATQREEGISGTDRGTAYHKVMELMNFNEGEIESQFNKWLEKHLISKEQLDAVPKHKIEQFMGGSLAKRMAQAEDRGELWKEQPFVLGIGADRVNSQYPDTETVLLQGIIDAFFIEDDKIVLVDYKTDVIKTKEELRDRYFIQIDYYKEALTRILGKEVKESILYSFYLGEEVIV